MQRDADEGDFSWSEIQRKARRNMLANYVLTHIETFSSWINAKFQQHLPEKHIEITNIFDDLHDGVLLIYLLEILSGKSLGRRNEGPNLSKMKAIENLNLALAFIANENIFMVGIGAPDLYDKNVKLTMALIWILILRYQIGQDQRSNTKQAMIKWCNQILPYSITSEEFKSKWENGKLYVDVVRALIPDAFSSYNFNIVNDLELVTFTQKVAEEQLEIPKIIKPDDLLVVSDENLQVLILSYFKNRDLKTSGFLQVETNPSPSHKNLLRPQTNMPVISPAASQVASDTIKSRLLSDFNIHQLSQSSINLYDLNPLTSFLLTTLDDHGNFFSGELKVSIKSPTSINMPVQLKPICTGIYECSFHSAEPGLYAVEVESEDCHMANQSNTILVEKNPLIEEAKQLRAQLSVQQLQVEKLLEEKNQISKKVQDNLNDSLMKANAAIDLQHTIQDQQSLILDFKKQLEETTLLKESIELDKARMMDRVNSLQEENLSLNERLLYTQNQLSSQSTIYEGKLVSLQEKLDLCGDHTIELYKDIKHLNHHPILEHLNTDAKQHNFSVNSQSLYEYYCDCLSLFLNIEKCHAQQLLVIKTGITEYQDLMVNIKDESPNDCDQVAQLQLENQSIEINVQMMNRFSDLLEHNASTIALLCSSFQLKYPSETGPLTYPSHTNEESQIQATSFTTDNHNVLEDLNANVEDDSSINDTNNISSNVLNPTDHAQVYNVTNYGTSQDLSKEGETISKLNNSSDSPCYQVATESDLEVAQFFVKVNLQLKRLIDFASAQPPRLAEFNNTLDIYTDVSHLSPDKIDISRCKINEMILGLDNLFTCLERQLYHLEQMQYRFPVFNRFDLVLNSIDHLKNNVQIMNEKLNEAKDVLKDCMIQIKDMDFLKSKLEEFSTDEFEQSDFQISDTDIVQSNVIKPKPIPLAKTNENFHFSMAQLSKLFNQISEIFELKEQTLPKAKPRFHRLLFHITLSVSLIIFSLLISPSLVHKTILNKPS